ncbi:MAG: S8 family serine peptidase [Candidatus Caldarchaeum sp.]
MREVLLYLFVVIMSVSSIHDGFAAMMQQPSAVDGVVSPMVREMLHQLGFSHYMSRRYYPLLDAGLVDIGVDRLLNVSGVNVKAVDGRGVLIAVVDTGVDYSHPTFRTDDGTRIVAIWDQTVGGKPPQGFGYGYECDRQEIVSGDCPQRDTVGHGTVVASIAAGGFYGDRGLRGVASGAELVVVKSGGPACGGARWFFSEEGLLDGIAYAVEKARQLGRRLVVVLSLGTDIGAHDGSTPLEKALDKWAEEGVVFVVAAGNSANDARHVEATLTRGVTLTLQWTIPPQTTEAALSLVTHPENIMDLTLTTPGLDRIELALNSSKTVNETILETSLQRTDKLQEIDINIRGNTLETGVWRLTLTPQKVVDGKMHAWLESDTCSTESEAFLPSQGYSITSSYTVTIPGTAKKVLTVGAYTTRAMWNASGQTWSVGGIVGDIEFYSGRGPTTDGRTKPDITAPGGVVFAARSRDATRQAFSPGEDIAVSRGTSMAAPHAAGVAALILQLAPNLSPQEVFEIIRNTARRDSYTGDTVSNIWGHGKLNADIAYVLVAEIDGHVAEARPTILLDNTPIANASTAGSTNLVLLRNRQANISLQLPSTSYTRYISTPSHVIVNGEQEKARFVIDAYHRVDVFYPNGTLVDIAWAREGEVLDIGSLLRAKGLKLGLRGYVDEAGVEHSGTFLRVTAPTRVTLVLEEPNILTPVLGTITALVLLVLLAAAAMRLLRRYRNSGTSPSSTTHLPSSSTALTTKSG